MFERLGNVLLIANPAAKNGEGAEAARIAEGQLKPKLGEGFRVILTRSERHATELAEIAEGYDTILALGGDGVIHEVANGLMQRAPHARPKFGVIPVGSGNDYARAIGMSRNIDEACKQLLEAYAQPVDVGCVNGRYFIETLSFGLDAAIALDTMERRVKTGRTGTILYAEAGFNQLFNNLRSYTYTASFNGDTPTQGSSITFAVQIGPFYGGGFKVCPEARLSDGEFDICISHPPVGKLRAAYLFLKAKNGGHTQSKEMDIFRAKSISVVFDEEPPAQIDGERIIAKKFDVSLLHDALKVLSVKRI